MKAGLKLEGKKEASLVSWAIARPRTPERVMIPVPEETAELCVTAGSIVRLGDLLAAPAEDSAVSVHASIAGQVQAIRPVEDGSGRWVRTVVLESGGRDEKCAAWGEERSGWEALPRQQLLQILQNHGVVGLADLIPVHVSCAPEHYGKAHTLVINACESEPYVTSDYALILSHPSEILKGAAILKKLTGAGRVLIAIEDDKLEAAELLKSKIFLGANADFEVRILPARYPQGLDAVLVETLFGNEASEWAENQDLRESVQIHVPGTALAVYEAVVQSKPFTERAVTIGGECVAESKNVWVPLGTPVSSAFKFCKGLLREPRKIVQGGPMRGQPLSHQDVPVLAGTNALLALPKEVALDYEIHPCIRCTKCVEACPVGISPAMITLAAERDLFDVAADWGAASCIECSNCAYVCPSKRPMVDMIRYADTRISMPVKSPARPLPVQKTPVFAENLS